MQEWIGELQQSALEQNPGAQDAAWATAAQLIDGEIPEELQAVWSAMDGALLGGEVRLWPISGWKQGPGRAVQIGRRGRGQRIFLVRRQDAYGLAPAEFVPAWIEALEPDAWLYAASEGDGGALKIYRSLQRMLEVFVPPRETEDFGELTFARALSAVQEALGALQPGLNLPQPDPELAREVAALRKSLPRELAEAKLSDARRADAKRSPARGAKRSAGVRAAAGSGAAAAKKAVAVKKSAGVRTEGGGSAGGGRKIAASKAGAGAGRAAGARKAVGGKPSATRTSAGAGGKRTAAKARPVKPKQKRPGPSGTRPAASPSRVAKPARKSKASAARAATRRR